MFSLGWGKLFGASSEVHLNSKQLELVFRRQVGFQAVLSGQYFQELHSSMPLKTSQV